MQDAPAIAISLVQPQARDHSLVLGIIFSLLLHVLLFSLLITSALRHEKPLPYVVNVVIEPPLEPVLRTAQPTENQQPSQDVPKQQLPLLPNQIVSEPQNSGNTAAPPKNARFLAEQNAAVEKEQIRRGDGPDSGPAPGKKAAPESPAPPAAVNKTARNAIAFNENALYRQNGVRDLSSLDLKLDSSTLLEKFPAETKDTQPGSRAQARLDRPIGAYEAFSRPSGSGARFLGMPGSADYIPDLPDGDITMLNTKASHFAVFVRRVAVQVFSQLRSVGWEHISAADIKAITEFCTVRATLSRQGELISAKIEGASGSPRFDQVVRLAAERGARDPNPPPEALSSRDTFEFIFKARSWVRLRSNPRTGTPAEARWLLLGTGLE
jgi:TonB family protein